MPTTKLAFKRLLLIDKMIWQQRPRYPSLNELLFACQQQSGIRSISTIEKDLQALRDEFGAPLKYNRLYRGYYYQDPKFNLMGVRLTPENLQALQLAEPILQAHGDTSLNEQFSDALNKIETDLQVLRLMQVNPRNHQYIETEKAYNGYQCKYLTPIAEAIRENRKIRFCYQKFDGSSPFDVILHPVKLKEFNRRWYVLGFDEKSSREKTFGLERILTLDTLDVKSNVPETALDKIARMFDYIYGITDEHRQVEKLFCRSPLLAEIM